jgi:hypothetical protein
MRKPLIFILFFIVPTLFFSCKNNLTDAGGPPQITYASPTTQAVKVTTKKLNRSKIKTIIVHPLVKKFGLDKLPVSSYDSVGFKPLKYPIEKTKINLDALPGYDPDIGIPDAIKDKIMQPFFTTTYRRRYGIRVIFIL